ncbi:MAG: Crp/Fnr family transcriptional regulator [Bacteroidia bacterium]
MELLRKNLLGYHSLSDEITAQFLSRFKLEELRKGDYLLRYGQVCKQIGFVEEGSVVYLAHNGRDEKVCDFAFEGQWVTYVKSLMSGNPSELSIQAAEPLLIAVIDTDSINELMQVAPQTIALQHKLMQDGMVEMAQRSVDLVNLTAEERYQKLLKSHPQLFQRFPLGHIASYLGITQRHLNRLRGGK